MHAWRVDNLGDVVVDSNLPWIAFSLWLANQKFKFVTTDKINGINEIFSRYLSGQKSKLLLTDKKKKQFKTVSGRQAEKLPKDQFSESFIDEALLGSESSSPTSSSKNFHMIFDESGNTLNKVKEQFYHNSADSKKYVNLSALSTDSAEAKTAFGTLVLNTEMMDLDIHTGYSSRTPKNNAEQAQEGSFNQADVIQDKLKIKALESKISKLIMFQTENTTLQTTINSLTAQTTILSSEKTVVITKLRDFEKRFDDSQAEVIALKQRIRELEELLASKNMNLSVAEKKLEEVMSENDIEKLKFKKHIQDLEVAATAKDSELEKFQKHITDLELSLSHKIVELNTAHGNVSKLEKTVSDLTHSSSTGQSTLNSLVNDLRANLANSVAEQDALARQLNDRTHELTAVQAQLFAANALAATAGIAAAADGESLRFKVSSTESALDSIRKENAQLLQLLSNSQADLHTAAEELKSVQAKLAEEQKNHAAESAAAENAAATLAAALASAKADATEAAANISSGSSPDAQAVATNLRFSELETAVSRVRGKALGHHDELVTLLALFPLELHPQESSLLSSSHSAHSSLSNSGHLGLQSPLKSSHLSTGSLHSAGLVTPGRTSFGIAHSPHEIDLSNGKISDLQHSLSANKSKLQQMLEMGEQLKTTASRPSSTKNLLEGTPTSRLGTDSPGGGHFRKTSFGSFENVLPDDERATVLLAHIAELTALIESDESELEKLRGVAERVNAQIADLNASLKGAFHKVFDLEQTLNKTMLSHSRHDNDHSALISQLMSERALQDEQLEEQSRMMVERNEEIERFIEIIGSLNTQLAAKSEELAAAHAHFGEIDSHLSHSHAQFHSRYNPAEHGIPVGTAVLDTVAKGVPTGDGEDGDDSGVANASSHMKRLALLRDTLYDMKHYLKHKTAELLTAHQRITQLEAETVEKAAESAAKSERIASLEAELVTLKDAQSNTASQDNTRITELEQALLVVKNLATTAAERHEADLLEAATKRNDLLSQISELTQWTTTKNFELEQMKNTVEARQSEVRSLSTLNTELQSLVNTQQDELNDNKYELIRLKQTSPSKTSQRFASYERSLADAKLEAKTAQDNFAAQLSESMMERSKLVSRLSDAESASNAALNGLKAQLSDATTALESKIVALEKVNHAVETLTAELHTLRSHEVEHKFKLTTLAEKHSRDLNEVNSRHLARECELSEILGKISAERDELVKQIRHLQQNPSSASGVSSGEEASGDGVLTDPTHLYMTNVDFSHDHDPSAHHHHLTHGLKMSKTETHQQTHSHQQKNDHKEHHSSSQNISAGVAQHSTVSSSVSSSVNVSSSTTKSTKSSTTKVRSVDVTHSEEHAKFDESPLSPSKDEHLIQSLVNKGEITVAGLSAIVSKSPKPPVSSYEHNKSFTDKNRSPSSDTPSKVLFSDPDTTTATPVREVLPTAPVITGKSQRVRHPVPGVSSSVSTETPTNVSNNVNNTAVTTSTTSGALPPLPATAALQQQQQQQQNGGGNRNSKKNKKGGEKKTGK